MRMFNKARMDAHRKTIGATSAGHLIDAMIEGRLTPSVAALLLDVKTSAITRWIYGQSLPTKAKHQRAIQLLRMQIHAAVHNNQIPKTFVPEDDLKNWHIGVVDYENIKAVISKYQ